MAARYDLTLATTLSDFEKLHRQIAGVRSDVGVVMVNKAALMHLLYDHSQMCAAIEGDIGKTITLVEDDEEARLEALKVFKQYQYIRD